MADIDRWAAKVDYDEATGCLNWQAYKSAAGYAQFRYDGSNRLAHRFILEYVLGRKLGPGMNANHLCPGNRSCVNPNHLYEGTQQENVRDAVEAGTHGGGKRPHCPAGHEYRGSNLRVSKNGYAQCRRCDRDRHRVRKPQISIIQVLAIRALSRSGVTGQDIASVIGTTPATVSRVLTGRTRANIDDNGAVRRHPSQEETPEGSGPQGLETRKEL